MIERHYIGHHNFEWIVHDPNSGLLVMSFLSGGMHSFQGVPASVVEQFLATDAKTEFFLQQIKPNFPLSMSKGKG